MSEPLVTFVIPAYDQTEPYVRAAIESVRAQTLEAWACVVLDDWPGDSAYERIADSYGDARVRYVRNDGEHGIGAAWNAGLALVRTPFATLLHADDVLEPGYARAMLDLAERFPDAASYACEPTLIDENGRVRHALRDRMRDAIMAAIRPPGDPYVVRGWEGVARLSLANFIICPGILYRIGALEGRRFSARLRFVLDLDFNVETLLHGQTIAGTTRRLIRSRRHATQATNVLGSDDLGFLEEIAYLRAMRERIAGTRYARASFFTRLSPFVRLNLAIAAAADLASRRPAKAMTRLRRLVRSVF